MIRSIGTSLKPLLRLSTQEGRAPDAGRGADRAGNQATGFELATLNPSTAREFHALGLIRDSPLGVREIRCLGEAPETRPARHLLEALIACVRLGVPDSTCLELIDIPDPGARTGARNEDLCRLKREVLVEAQGFFPDLAPSPAGDGPPDEAREFTVLFGAIRRQEGVLSLPFDKFLHASVPGTARRLMLGRNSSGEYGVIRDNDGVLARLPAIVVRVSEHALLHALSMAVKKMSGYSIENLEALCDRLMPLSALTTDSVQKIDWAANAQRECQALNGGLTLRDHLVLEHDGFRYEGIAISASGASFDLDLQHGLVSVVSGKRHKAYRLKSDVDHLYLPWRPRRKGPVYCMMPLLRGASVGIGCGPKFLAVFHRSDAVAGKKQIAPMLQECWLRPASRKKVMWRISASSSTASTGGAGGLSCGGNSPQDPERTRSTGTSIGWMMFPSREGEFANFPLRRAR